MADAKTQELSPGEWHELLEPYGWADITVRSPAVRFRVPASLLEYEIRVMLEGSPDVSLGEWAHRSYLLEQARLAVEAVRARGYSLGEAPRIEFGGRYAGRIGADPAWLAEAEVSFSVRLAR